MTGQSDTEAVRSHLEAVRLQLELLTDPNLQPSWDYSAPHERPTSPREFSWLGSHPDEVSELAALLHEAAPKLGLSGYRQPATAKALPRRPSYEVSQSLKDRVKSAAPVAIGAGVLDWSRLAACISSEMIKLEDHSPSHHGFLPPLMSSRPSTAGSEMLEINSGGRVFFCLFHPPPYITPPCSRVPSPAKPPRSLLKRGGAQEGDGGSDGGAAAISADCTAAAAAAVEMQQQGVETDTGADAAGAATTETLPLPAPLEQQQAPLQLLTAAAALAAERYQAHPAQEQCVVVKFLPSRLLTQSEQFANELTRHVGICSPETRILRQNGSSAGAAGDDEWQCALDAAAAIRDRYPDLAEEMGRSNCMLVIEYIPGRALFKSREAWTPEHLTQTMEDVGRLVMLDMLLGNSDRLPVEELGWRGNLENVMYAGAGPWAGRLVAIDAVVQRRPPGGLLCAEDAACEKLAELALNDLAMAGSVLREAVGCSRVAVAAADREDVVKAFQRGLKTALGASMTIKGLLEMMFEVISEWIDGFLADIEMCHNVTPRPASRRVSSTSGTGAGVGWDPNTTFKIRMISHEAQRNQTVSEKVAHWKTVFREKGEELRHAVEEWQLKRATAGPRLTTGFLDGTNPIVDMYELKVRLEHMLQRLRVLQDAASTARPTRLLPRLYLSGAVEANSHHLLRYLGVTHILNATEDLLLPEPGAGFSSLRCPLRDVVEEDIAQFFPAAVAFISGALEAPQGGVLVHCHGGRSRSVSLVLAWLMVNRRWTLRRALEWVQRHRPEAAPNAGYMAALLRLEEELFGQQTVKVKKTKPEPKVCPLCEEKVGLSAESVKVHLRQKHQAELALSEVSSPRDSSLGSPALALGSPTCAAAVGPGPAAGDGGGGRHPPSRLGSLGPQQGAEAAAEAAAPSPAAGAAAEVVQQQQQHQQQQQQQPALE